ncbi:hypothetical protein CIRG_09764 [Coccidioides immitis RMSCC 2394]|uniref:Uncharacterized protein n=1 Tax=Coccidioides immitis RMSCC 2394 TaxID=404692 RepID=A0A0J6YQU2_COCIT|nr:hypothetical protein CIRG_09764 [Coccidioides immitis RMSCC 2394]
MCSSSEVSFLQIWAILRPLRSTHHEIPLSFLAILRVLTPDTMRRELRNPIFPVRTWVMIVRSGLDFATPGPSMPAAPCLWNVHYDKENKWSVNYFEVLLRCPYLNPPLPPGSYILDYEDTVSITEEDEDPMKRAEPHCICRDYSASKNWEDLLRNVPPTIVSGC